MKTMKKASFQLLAVLAMGSLMVLGACSDGEDDGPPPTPEPTAGFTISTENPVAGEEISFTSTSTDATAFQWSFGDGTTSADENPTHSYESEGSFTVTLSVTGEGGNASLDTTVTVVFPRAIYADGIELSINSVSLSADGNTAAEIGTYPENARHFPVAVNSSATELYYIDNFDGILYKANIDGSGQTVLNDDAGFFYPSDIAVDTDGNLYITDRGDSFSGEGATVYKVTSAGVASVLYTNTDGLEVPTAIVVDPATGDLYINDVGAEDTGYAADGIWKGTTSGGAITKEITGGGYSIALGSGNIYFNEAFVDGNIKFAPLSDLSNTAKFADLDEANSYGLHYFSGKVYWSDLGANVDGGEGTIKRAAAEGGAATTLLDARTDPRGLVVFK